MGFPPPPLLPPHASGRRRLGLSGWLGHRFRSEHWLGIVDALLADADDPCVICGRTPQEILRLRGRRARCRGALEAVPAEAPEGRGSEVAA